MADFEKIIGVGLPRTGNVTLAACIRELFGVKIIGWHRPAADALLTNNWTAFRGMAEDTPCMVELPWASTFRELDAWFPASKFILTHREESSWIKSMEQQINEQKHPETKGGAQFREYFFGAPYPAKNEDKYLKKYHEHIQSVESYFEGRRDLLVISWAVHGWDELCHFFGVAKPSVAMPHLNRGTIHGKEILHL